MKKDWKAYKKLWEEKAHYWRLFVGFFAKELAALVRKH